jgi:hypothetical protein
MVMIGARRLALAAVVVGWGLAAAGSDAAAEVLSVGPNARFHRPSEAAAVAKGGDVVEIQAGDYNGDIAVWPQSDLVIRAAAGGRVHLRAGANLAEGKAIWVTKGNHLRIVGIEFSGARASDANGAGIRHEGGDLVVAGCFFHDNEDGILIGDRSAADVVIEHSEFARNGAGDGQSHNVYIGRVASFTFRFNYSHHAVVGHNLKSRALRNLIGYNVLADLQDGHSSYLIDLPDAGSSLIIGNVLQHGPHTENSTLIAYGAEAKRNPGHDLYVVNNTLASIDRTALFVVNKTSQPALVANNLFYGPGEPIAGPAEAKANQHHLDREGLQLFKAVMKDPGSLPGALAPRQVFRDPKSLDFHLVPGSPAIDAGLALDTANGFDLVPRFEVVHPLRAVPRRQIGPIDLGAFELAE